MQRVETETLALDEVQPGAVLAVQLCDASGMILLPAGCTLDEAILERLRVRGVERLQLVVPESAAARGAREAALQERLEHLFRVAGTGEAARELMTVVLTLRTGGTDER
ncbi:hypothetical protein TMEC54S_03762 [Thauera mechernichensis]